MTYLQKYTTSKVEDSIMDTWDVLVIKVYDSCSNSLSCLLSDFNKDLLKHLILINSSF